MGLHVGQNARIRVSLSTLVDNSYALTDPSALTATITRPDASTVTYAFGTDPELEQIGRGRFQIIEPLDQVGTWHIRWQTPTFLRTFTFGVAS